MKRCAFCGQSLSRNTSDAIAPYARNLEEDNRATASLIPI